MALCVDRGVAELPWLRAALRDLGCHVVTAKDGEAALDLVGDKPPDLILVALQLPGLGGLEVCRRITGEPQTRHLPVFVVAAASGERERVDALLAGAESLLAPPMSRPEAALRLGNALRRKHAHDDEQRRLRELLRITSARDGLVRWTLEDLATLASSAARALAGVEGSSGGPLNLDARRYLRVAEREVLALAETVATLGLVRAVEAGEWRFEPAGCDLTTVLSEAVRDAEVHVAARDLAIGAAADPGLRLVADAGLLAQAVTALVAHVAARAPERSGVEVIARALAAGVRIEVRATADSGEPKGSMDLVTAALQLTLARLVAEAHGGQLVTLGPGLALALELPPEPPAGTPWPPATPFRTGAPSAGEPAPSGRAEAAEPSGARTALAAPRQPRRLLPPTPG
ncbi:MAG: response regulator [Armatimonadetes bacterium]|nr:response regulator [Armatimonadota bacterium]